MPISEMNPVEILISRYQDVEKKGTSLREFSRFLDIHPSTLSKIISGKRGIPKSLATKMAAKLLDTEEERLDFIDSILNYKKISDRKTQDAKLIDPDQSMDMFLVISQWEFFAILNVIGLKKFDHSYDFIADSLGISLRRVVECMDILKRSGLIEIKNQKIQRTNKKIVTPNNLTKRALKIAHLEELDLAKAKINLPIERRYYQSSVIKVAEKDLSKIKKLVDKFMLDLDKITDNSVAEEVYLFSSQLFPLTQKIIPKKGNKKNEH